MFQNVGKQRILWFLVGFLSLVAGLIGLFSPEIYDKVVSRQVVPGVLSQDLVTIMLAIILLIFTVQMKEHHIKRQVLVLGLLSYFFYGYGIYVIERIYTTLYLIYMAIFALSFYSVIFGLASLRKEALPRVEMPNSVRLLSAGFLFFIPLFFYPLWIGRLLPLIQTGEKIEHFYSIYILDLCFVMPLLIIGAVKTIRKETLGLLLAPALLIKGFIDLFPVGLGEFFKPRFNFSVNTGEAAFYLGLAALFLTIAVLHLWHLRITTLRSE